MLHKEITGTILEGCFEVIKELGIGFIESVYEKALFVALKQKGLKLERQVPLKVKFRNTIVGEFYADLLIDEKFQTDASKIIRSSTNISTATTAKA